MTQKIYKHKPTFSQPRLAMAKMAAVSLIALSLAACRGDIDYDHRFGVAAPIDHDQMHPITVSYEKLGQHKIRFGSSSRGLGATQKIKFARFLRKYKFLADHERNARLLITVPIGAANAEAAGEAVENIQDIIAEEGFDRTIVKTKLEIVPHRERQYILISYLRFIAEGPECGNFPTNLASQSDNQSYENFGCTTQKNLAAVANPADLAGQRTMTPRSEARRRVVHGRYVAGRVTGANRSPDEQASTQN